MHEKATQKNTQKKGSEFKMNVHENLKTKSIDEMTDFLYTLSANDLSKCQILCNGQFCYQPSEKRECRQKLKEFLESSATGNAPVAGV